MSIVCLNLSICIIDPANTPSKMETIFLTVVSLSVYSL